MYRRLIFFLIGVLVPLFILSPTLVEATTSINYQGRLRIINGQLFTGSKDFKLFFYNASTGGTYLWETPCLNDITVDAGVFNFQFTPDLSSANYASDNIYMEVRVYSSTGACTTLEDTLPAAGGARSKITASFEALTLAGISGNRNTNLLGDSRIGLVTEDNGSTAGYGNLLNLSGGDDWAAWNSDNSDPIWLARYNVASDQSELRLNVGDGAASTDKFMVGTTAGGVWTPQLTVRMDGNVGIGTTSPQAKLDIYNGNLLLSGGDVYMWNGRTMLAQNSSSVYETFLWPRWSDNVMYLNFGSAGFNIRNNSSTSVMFMQNGGNVGIGTAGPVATFNVYKDADSSWWMGEHPSYPTYSALGTNGRGTGTGSYVLLADNTNTFLNSYGTGNIYFREDNNNLMTILNNGNVGIGTASPGYKLHVMGDIYANGGWLRVSGNQGLYWESWGPGWYVSDGTWLRTYNNASIWANTGTIGTNGSFSAGYGGTSGPAGGAIIAGNVGIGTVSPTSKLDVYGNELLSYSSSLGLGGRSITLQGYTGSWDSSVALRENGNWGELYANTGNFYINVNTNNNLYFLTNNTQRMIINSSGNVGIGTDSPVTRLGVVGGLIYTGDINTRYGAQVSGDDSGKAIFGSNLYAASDNTLRTFGTHGSYGYSGMEAKWGAINFYTASGATTQDAVVTPTTRMIIATDGDVGIGTADPGSYKLNVNGGMYANTYTCASDLNLKENIQSLDSESMLDKIMQLRGVTFNWKEGDDTRTHLGLIAQEVEAVFPELVTTNSSDNLKSLEYQNLVVPLIEAVKEQQKEIEELRTMVNELKKNYSGY